MGNDKLRELIKQKYLVQINDVDCFEASLLPCIIKTVQDDMKAKVIEREGYNDYDAMVGEQKERCIQQANKILAEACGYTPLDGLSIRINNGELIEWTISDARCREVVRERFKLNTDTCLDGRWYCHRSKNVVSKITTEVFYGKTIAEAEIACMIKIAEGLDKS